ncbi:ABC transporter ATP-binding protein [Alicyclobacillus sp. SO9]|uniref:ABC transporter ATP-binding protein n=1 Tax=Alicyclobacillus sp. SO9 TaxID=2665646 RepID=UPI0018E73334|nr:ABC transporter ATP-binding protein [Alicyclobacillus sp. SO9]QQE76937.1 ABC transporter ATP-binding protein [Alicyclobacillus sp. SO9]
MLMLENVGKVFDYRPILEEVSLSLEPGVHYALTAPNGSGKTTLLEIMAGISRPTKGMVMWENHRLSVRDRRHIGAVFQQPMVYADLTAVENLELFARLYRCRNPKTLASEWLERVNLHHAAEERVRHFSKGMRQRVALARAMLHQPRLLLLDEPFDGLDTDSVLLFGKLLKELKDKGTTLFHVTHSTSEASETDIRLTLRYGRLVQT